jgi:hypothetical protein
MSSIEEKQTPLTAFELNMLSWIEQTWYKQGSLPSLDAICDEFNLNRRKLSNHTRKNAWKSSWAARGLPTRDMHSVDQATLSPRQLMVANIILNEHDRQSLKRKLELCNLTTSQFQAWMADPVFTNYLKKETDRRFGSADIFAHQSLARLVIDGDLNAIKYYFDITNRHSVQADTLNFNSILARLMEVLARYVTPAVLSQIADDLDEIVSGNPQPKPQLQLVSHENFLEIEEIESVEEEPLIGTKPLGSNLAGPVESVNQSRDEIAKMAFSLKGMKAKK